MRKGRPAKPVADRFWTKVDRREPNECWLWTAAIHADTGYGAFGWPCLKSKSGWKNVDAHRAAWELVFGFNPGCLDVLHTCDNPPCVNPGHLFLGTNKDNMLNMVLKGRSCRGEKNAKSKQTADRVALIRRSRASGESRASVADRFGMSLSGVDSIVYRKTWKHVE